MKLKTTQLKLFLLLFSFLWIQQAQGITLFLNAPNHSVVAPNKHKGVKKKKKEKLVKKLEKFQSKINRSIEKEKKKTKGDKFVIIGLSMIGLSLIFGLGFLLVSLSKDSLDYLDEFLLSLITAAAGSVCLIVGSVFLIIGKIMQSLDKKRALEPEKSDEAS